VVEVAEQQEGLVQMAVLAVVAAQRMLEALEIHLAQTHLKEIMGAQATVMAAVAAAEPRLKVDQVRVMTALAVVMAQPQQYLEHLFSMLVAAVEVA
jgi:hypothetical protein